MKYLSTNYIILIIGNAYLLSGGAHLENEKNKSIKRIVEILNTNVPNLIKYNGEIAKQLFLHDAFNLDNKVDISVERKFWGEVFKDLPNE